MDPNEASIKPVKKVFTTAHKNKTVIENKNDNANEKSPIVAELIINYEVEVKNKKPKDPKKPKVTKEPGSGSAAIIADKLVNDNGEIKSEKLLVKNPRKRSSKKKSEIEELCKEVKEINLKKSLSAEAVPFVPGKGEPVLSTSNSTSNGTKNTSKISTSNIIKPVRKPVSRPMPKEEDLRKVEVNQLQIRFAPTGFTLSKNSSEDSLTMQCVLPITDPEFSYDLDTIRIEIILPKGYPGTKTAPIRPCFSILNSNIPSTITARIDRNLKWGLNSLEGGILVCRPILRYLEDNLEKWMVDDVRESAFKFVKPSEIKVTEKPENLINEVNKSESESENEQVTDTKNSTTANPSSSSRISKGDWLAPPPVTDQSSVGGSPFTLKIFFSTIRGIDLLTSQRLTFLAACDRCKFNFPVEDLRPFVDRIEHCPKCTNQTKFCYKAQLVTPGVNYEDEDKEFESILGSVRFLRAKPVDLLPSLYQCACSRCYGSEEDQSNSSSSCKIEKVKIGENINYGCFNCHQKIRFQIDRIEWISEQVVGISAASSQKQQSKLAAKNGPVLSVGTPLPQSGACEHYKKSFRWYRFPCCGQAFPCDECHAKDPVAKDHPVEWATRFICGFCSREQSINIKECPECGKDTSASGRKQTSFWEGGKGTRNQVLMNRKDSKKYKNYSTNSSSTIKTKPKKST